MTPWLIRPADRAYLADSGPRERLALTASIRRAEESMGTPHTDPRDEVFVTTRPWGQFQQFSSGTPVTVKVMTIAPGHRLSLQRHGHRGEMWQVLDVPIQVTVGEETWLAQVGEIVWVPSGAVHRIGNPGEAPGRVLELAFGDFDEGDIERLEDDYAR